MTKLAPIFILLFVFAPASVLAYDFPIPYWGPLLSCGGGISCNFCHLFLTAWNIIRFLLTLLLIVAVPVMIVIGGILVMVSGPNESLLTLGKKTLTGAVIGLFLGLGSYLIVSTIIRVIGAKIHNAGLGGIAWPEIACEPEAIEILQTPSTSGNSNATTTGTASTTGQQ